MGERLAETRLVLPSRACFARPKESSEGSWATLDAHGAAGKTLEGQRLW